MATPPPNWSDSQKSSLVQQLITGGLSLQQACDQYGLSTEHLKDWVRIFRRSVRQALDHQLRSTLSVQGLDVDAFSSAEFSGNLADIAIADIVQTIQMGRKSAQITIAHDATESHIWCEAGEIVDAQSGSLGGEEALYRILSLERGNLVADFTSTERVRRITLSTPLLLLEAANRNDQRMRLLRRIGQSTQTFSVIAAIAAQRAAELSPDELGVLSLFDGSRSLDEVISACDLADNEALDVAVRFFEAGLLAPSTLARWSASETAVTRTEEDTPTSYRPFVGTLEPQPNHPPLWMMVAGAAACSSLGAFTAIAYSDGLLARQTALPANVVDIAAGAIVPTPPPATLCPNDMVLIRGGTFFMGSDSSHPALLWARPAHEVSVDSFCLDVHEVSVEDYSRCVDAGKCEPAHLIATFQSDGLEGTGSKQSEALHSEQCNAGKPGREHHPINCVSHFQAVQHCAFRGARLATEAEWEFSARGDTNRLFPWGNAQPTADHINACGKECEHWHQRVGLSNEMHGLMYEEDDGYSGTAPVGSFPLGATSDGVQDLIGNVFEWTSGGLYPFDRRPLHNPKGPAESESYVIRGGNFNSGIPEFSDPALRFAMLAESYSHGVGLRCADDPKFEAAPAPPASDAPPLTPQLLDRPGG